jgi:predicted lipoprotein with Yx(FWY)xxD motif
MLNLAGRRHVYPGMRWTWRGLMRVAGAGLLAATGGIHLDLYLTGYRSVPTIGALFLLQVIVAFLLALAVLFVVPTAPLLFAAASGAAFAVATLGGYLLSIWAGLFGFREVRTTAGIVAGVIEIAAFVVLALLAIMALPAAGALARAARRATPAIGGLSLVALVLLVAAVAGAGGGTATTSATAVLKIERIGGVNVLTNAKGFTLYSFAPDSATISRCYGSCAAYWPPVTGTPVAGSGITGRLGTLRRSDGSLQVTYDGHPLYTYVGDSAPGQDSGNNLRINGGLWQIVPAAG